MAVHVKNKGNQVMKKIGHGHGNGHQSEVVALGTVTVGGATFAVDREGAVEAGKTSTFGVELVGAKEAVPDSAWLVDWYGSAVLRGRLKK